MMCISLVSLLALTFGAPYCDRIRRQREETRYTDAAIEAAFRDEKIPNGLSDEKISPSCDKLQAAYPINSEDEDTDRFSV